MQLYDAIMGQLVKGVTNLDWDFIFTFMLMAYAINQDTVKEALYRIFRFRVLTRYRTFLLGLLYAVALFFLRGKSIMLIESLFRSLLFTMIFHKLIIEQAVIFFTPHSKPDEEHEEL